jgi:hypothetical protein
LTTTVESATTVEGALGALSTNKQAKTLSTSVESQTTVEGALSALSTNKATQAEVNDMNNVLGAKNLLPNNAVTQVKSGITFTVNSDGSIRLTGTATAAVSIDLPVDLTDGVTYTASGISGGSFNTYQVYLQTADGLSTSHGVIYDGEFTFIKNSGQTSPNNDVHIYRIRVSSGVTVDTVIYPMIRLASITDNTYVPYAKSNKELTDEKLDISSLKTITAASSDFADFKTRIAAL